MSVPEYKAETLYESTKVGTKSLCTHRFLLVLGHATALNSMLSSCFKMASDPGRTVVFLYICIQLYVASGTTQVRTQHHYVPVPRHYFFISFK